ncbi:hypothetical protein E4M02_11120 [Brevundimonas sp. S30B]|uniref:hypothetical protein n=1 Tax=unclassified Brevundimonas TaxID=2622653 RepID=UPI0010721883|nr:MULTISPECIES: hypothetical protein [unclassified Brevundimonas]QBX38665.1 hypothetical protein E4M01_13380 [Brevundimonas sp. MF30-B]TFW01256.1 hypothetical protein E4M02_11120 [Brevundimonas sp. S30B]
MTEKFKVTRQVLFDRLYQDGETYEGSASEVEHLVANGVLVPLKGKSEAPPKNKAAPKPENKAS